MSLRGPIKSPSLYFTSAQPVKLEKFCGLYRRKRGGSPIPRALSCLKGNWARITPDPHATPRYPDWNTASPSARRGQATQPAPAPPAPGSSPSGTGRDPQQATKRRQAGASFTLHRPVTWRPARGPAASWRRRQPGGKEGGAPRAPGFHGHRRPRAPPPRPPRRAGEGRAAS